MTDLEKRKSKRLRAIKKMTRRIQDKIMKIGLATGCGHIASAMSVTECLVTTYLDQPNAIIILSKGHGALAQYLILNELGKLSDKRLDSYYKDGGLSGHATLSPEEGVYASTGSLGHGLPIGIGYAIANPDKNVIVIMSDGELEEGSNLESLYIIKRLRLTNILPVVEINGWQGMKEADADHLPFVSYMGGIIPRPYYSTKGKFWGELEDTLQSHYTKVTPELYKLYLKSR